MILKPSDEVLKRLGFIYAQPAQQSVISWIRESRDKLRENLEKQEGTALMRTQGAAQFASELLEYLEEANRFFRNRHPE